MCDLGTICDTWVSYIANCSQIARISRMVAIKNSVLFRIIHNFTKFIERFIAQCCTILFIKIDKVYHNILYYCFVLHKILFCLIDHCLHQQELEGSRTGRRAAPGPGIGHDCTAGRWIGHDCTGRAIMYYTMWWFAQYNDLYIEQFSCNIY